MLSPHADDDMPMNALLPFMLGALDEAEDAVEVAGGGAVEAAMRARVLARDLEDLSTALAGGGDGGYWMGRVARLEREAALVEEAGRRGGEWHDLLYRRVEVVEDRILEASARWTDHARQLRTDLARGWAPGEEEAAMELEARAVAVEARAAEDRMEVTAARNRLGGGRR